MATWDTLCLPKSVEGLNITNLEIWTRQLCGNYYGTYPLRKTKTLSEVDTCLLCQWKTHLGHNATTSIMGNTLDIQC